MILLDTTVLAYAVGEEHPLRGPGRWLLDAHGAGRITATTTVEVLQEFLHVRSRRRPRDEAVTLTRAFADAFDVVVAAPGDFTAGLVLFARYPRLGAFDSVLAAVAMSSGAGVLVSADRAFSGVDGLTWLDLAGPDLQVRLLG